MRKALQITGFLLILSFLIYLVPPVRDYVNESFQAQVSEFVQLEQCGCTEDSPDFFCITKFVPAGTCIDGQSTSGTNTPQTMGGVENPNEIIKCDVPEQAITTIVERVTCILEYGGTVIEDNESQNTIGFVDEQGATSPDLSEMIKNELTKEGFITESQLISPEQMIEIGSNQNIDLGELMKRKLEEDGFIDEEKKITEEELKVLTADASPALKETLEKKLLETGFLESSFHGIEPKSPFDDGGKLITPPDGDGAKIGQEPIDADNPEKNPAESGEERVDPTKETVLLGGKSILDPAGAGFDEAKTIVEAALGKLGIAGQSVETLLPTLAAELGLEGPLGPGIEKLLRECINDRLGRSGEGALVGAAPQPGEENSAGATVNDPGGSTTGTTPGASTNGTNGGSEDTDGVKVAPGRRISLGGKEYDLSVDDDLKLVKLILEGKIRELLMSDIAYESLLGLLGLEPPINASLEELIRACLRFFGDMTDDAAEATGTDTGGTVTGGDTGGNTVGGTVVRGGEDSGETIGGTENPDGTTMDPPTEETPPKQPPTTTPPPEYPPPPPPPVCPQCPSLFLWDAGAAHDGGVLTHYEWDGPHFMVGRLVPLVPTGSLRLVKPDPVFQGFQKIEEPIVWLGQGDKSVDGELEPHCCDDENASIDQDGLVYVKSNKNQITAFLQHIAGAASNPANPPTTHLGTYIVARYKRVAAQDYEFYVIDAIPVRQTGEVSISVNDPFRMSQGVLDGEGWLRLIYMDADEVNYGFTVEEIENDWDGTHSKLMEIINLPAINPFDPSIPKGEVEDYWYGEDCGGNFGFYDPMRIPYCPETLSEPAIQDKININVVCENTNTNICNNDNNGGNGDFGNSAGEAEDNGPLGEYLESILKDPADNNPQIRLEKMLKALIAYLAALANKFSL